MPTYEYKCSKCEEVFEIFQKMTDAPLKECPVCGGELSKVISGGIGIIFKGSGFYTTDYKNASSVGPSPAGKSGKDSDKEQGSEKGKDSAKDSSAAGSTSTDSTSNSNLKGKKSADTSSVGSK